jgi:hypothetical protein
MGDSPQPLFVSSVEGHHVTRYGTGTLIGAEVDLQHPGNLRFDTAKVVMIPAAEYAAHKREYDHLLETGSLERRTPGEYRLYQERLTTALDAAAAKAKAEAKKSAEEADAKAKSAADKAAKEQAEIEAITEERE